MKTDCDLQDHVPGWPSLDGVLMQAPDETGLIDFYQAHGFKGLATSLDAGELSLPTKASAPEQCRWFE